MLKYCSIDIETTGLLPKENDIIEFGCVIDDLGNPKPIEELPKFHCYFKLEKYVGQPFALSMHSEIFRRIALETEGFNYYNPLKFGYYFKQFLVKNGYKLEKDRTHITVAGKNFASFDLQFLNEKTDLKNHVKISHKIFDPASLFVTIEDESLPGTSECYKRAGIDEYVAHNSIDDAIGIVKLIRYKMLGKNI